MTNSSQFVRICAQIGLLIVGVLSAKEFSSILLALPVAVFAIGAAWRNDNKMLDSIDVFWFLFMLFFFVRPAQALSDNTLVLLFHDRSLISYSHEQIAMTFAIIDLSALICFIFMPYRGYRSSKVGIYTSFNQPVLLLIIIAANLGVIWFSGGIENLWRPRYSKDYGQISIILPAFQAVQIVASTFFVAEFIRNKHHRLSEYGWLASVLALLFISLNPLNSARFALIAGWLPILFILIPILRKPAMFYGGAMFALVVLLPILSVTSRFGLDWDKLSNIEDMSIFEIPYIDPFDMLLQAVYHTEIYGHTFGSKLVAIVLFFVPRSVWPGKPIVSGLDVGTPLYQSGFVGTSNLSMNIIGDFYMDFGIFGVVVGCTVTVLMFRWLLRQGQDIGGSGKIFEYLIIANLPILVRGSVGAVLPLFMSVLVSYWIIYKLVGKSYR